MRPKFLYVTRRLNLTPNPKSLELQCISLKCSCIISLKKPLCTLL